LAARGTPPHGALDQLGRDPQAAGGELDELVAQDPLRQRADDAGDLAERLVAARALERPLNLEARERDRAIEQPRHPLGAALLPHDVGGVGARRQPDDAQLEPLRQHGRGAHRGLAAGRVGVEAQQHDARQPADLARLLGGEGRAHHAHRVAEAGLVERDHVRVALGEHDRAGLRRRRARDVDPEQLAALGEHLALARVDVLRPLAVAHRARPEAAHAPAAVGEREHDLAAEDVVDAALAPARRQPGREHLLVAVARAPRGVEHRVPRARRVADAELAQRALGQPAAEQVLARAGRLARLPQHAHVVGRGPLEQREQARLAVAPLGRPRVLRLGLELDPRPLGERLERGLEVEPLGLHHELEDVAALAAAEAVVELLDRVDAERRRPLVVERAQPRVAPLAGLAQLGARADELDEVDRVAHALLRVGRVARH
jgi:hypothetical protein